ncbi:type I polyketide synthase [Actinosynnema sp. NPDC050436]|uniref:type I polyketide synthase n=1 Tax=Actinosynnema sp. NPDC050436 TaxID=3155659 RepID=UPI00340B0465
MSHGNPGVPARRSAADFSEEADAATRSEYRERLDGASEGIQRRMLVEVIREAAAAVLGSGPGFRLRADRAFHDLGFSRRAAGELRTEVGARTGVRLEATALFDHPSAEALAEHLRNRLLGVEEAAVALRPLGQTDEPIAIVGMGCRFPGGADSPEGLWDLVASGRDVVSGLPVDRGWDVEGLFDPDPGQAGLSYVREGGFLAGAGDFDAGFFGVSPREAVAMDPQQRLLLEVSWEAVERAGVDPRSLRGSRTGVFTGVVALEGYGPALRDTPADVAGHRLTGTIISAASGRVAYALGLEGPTMTIDTGCSSSLVALHLACDSLRRGESSLALVGGATVMSLPGIFPEFSMMRGFSPDGRCKAFSDRANGTGLSEGVGVLVVERLSDARRAGRRVLAVVRGSAVNQDGASNGLTAPSGVAQRRVIVSALSAAGLSSGDVDVVEAHGTGTALGDPIEAGALLATYGRGRNGVPLWLGSLKSNIGHTQAAAGVAGVIKMVLALDRGVLPKTLHVDRPSRHVDWSSGEVSLLTESIPWPETGRARRAGVSSFGMSGTNSHVILEQGDPVAEAGDSSFGGVVPWVVSGRSAGALRDQALRLREFAAGEDLDAAAVGRSLVTSRSTFEHRAVVLGDDREGFLRGLDALSGVGSGLVDTTVVQGVARAGVRSALLFPGQGAQRNGLGRALHHAFPVFAAAFDAVCEQVDDHLERPLREVAFADEGTESALLLDQTQYTQVALFAFEVSLFRLLEHWGVTPDFLLGHSVGELAAAHVAGVLSLPDACAVVVARGRLMQRLTGSAAMVSIQADEQDVLAAVAECAGQVAVAAINGPRSVVVSGTEADVLALAEEFARRGCRTKRLRVSHAFHSPQMDGMLDDFLRVVEHATFRPPRIPVVSNLTGSLAPADMCDPRYWVRHVREAVRFGDGISWLRSQGVEVFLELGGAGVLTTMARQCLENHDGNGPVDPEQRAVCVPAVVAGDAEPRSLVDSVARVFVTGVDVDWTRLFDGDTRLVDLPTYAFQRERYWLEVPSGRPAVALGGDDRFWDAVASGDRELLAGLLDVDTDQPFSALLPALASWRKRRGDLHTAGAWRYRVVWKQLAEPTPGDRHGTWLVVVPASHADDPAVRLVDAALAERGVRALPLVVDAAHADRHAVAATLGDVVTDDRRPVTRVLSFLALADEECVEGTSVPVGLASSVALVQALGESFPDARLWCVTRGAVATSASDAVAGARQRQVWGLGTTVGLEQPRRWGGLVDLPEVVDERAAALLHGVVAAGSGEDQVAVRPCGLYGSRLLRVTSDLDRELPDRVVGGTVLVTGGTGALGGQVARWLAAHGAAHLVLVSRSGVASDDVAALLAEVERGGTRVTVRACDVADRPQLAALLAEFPPSAVVHAAGVLDDGVVDSITPQRVDAVFRPKVQGAVNLSELTSSLELTAFVLFSSVAATLGNAGQGAYAAANAFLDGLAEQRRARGLPATSIAWGAWADLGMAVRAGVEENVQRKGFRGMEAAPALAALGRALGDGEACSVVADVEWDAAPSWLGSDRPRPLFGELPEVARATPAGAVATSDADDLRDRLSALPQAEQVRSLVELVQAEAAKVLGHATGGALDPTRGVMDLGFDSLTALELRNRLGGATGLALPATLVFDYPTLSALAEHLRSHLVSDDARLHSALADLDAAVRALADLELPDAEAGAVAGRLEKMLAALAPAAAVPARPDLDGASDDELFDLLDRAHDER